MGDDSLTRRFNEGFTELLNSLGVRKFGIACSGGPDSMALVWLAHQWLLGQSGQYPQTILPVAIIVHGMRSEALGEARDTAQFLNKFPHIQVTILEPDSQSRLPHNQETARQLRYRLLRQWAFQEGIEAIGLAHHQQDQIETIAMRLAKGSGFQGLAGMAPIRTETLPIGLMGLVSGEDNPFPSASRERGWHRLHWLRPLIGVQKSELQALIIQQAWPYTLDPSNLNSRFERVRWRKLMPHLSVQANDPIRESDLRNLAGLASTLANWADSQLSQWANGRLKINPHGLFGAWSAGDWLNMPPAWQTLFLGYLFRLFAPHAYPPRQAALQHWQESLAKGVPRLVLQGWQILKYRDDYWFCREEAAIKPLLLTTATLATLAHHALSYDGQWLIAAPSPQIRQKARLWQDHQIGPCPQDLRSHLRGSLAHLPPPVRHSLPCLIGPGGKFCGFVGSDFHLYPAQLPQGQTQLFSPWLDLPLFKS